MKKSVFGVILLLAVSLTGCSREPSQHYQVTGYVRSVWVGDGYRTPFTVLIEESNGQMRSLRFTQVPPVWLGMHCTIEWDRQGVGNAQNVHVTRLP